MPEMKKLKTLKELSGRLAACVFTICAFAFFGGISVQAKTAADPFYGFDVRFYNSETDLGTSSVNAIVQSDDGYIWIGTYTGLYR